MRTSILIVEFLIFTFFFYSCLDNVHYESHVTEFTNIKEVSLQKIHIKEVIRPDFFTKVDNRLVISSSISDTMLYYYSIPGLNLIKKEGIKGNGQNEFSAFPMFCRTPGDESLYIWGYNNLLIKKFVPNDIDEFDYQKEFILSKYEAFNYMHILNDSLLIYYLPDLLSIKKYDLISHVFLDEKNLEKERHGESYFYSNRGMIAANDSCIVHAYLFKRRIDIYDINTLELKHVIIDKGESQNIVLGDFNNLVIYHQNIVAGKKYFYVLHDNGRKEYAIETYDYNGNPVVKYKVDIMPQIFIIDEDNNAIYGYNSEFEDYLLYGELIQY